MAKNKSFLYKEVSGSKFLIFLVSGITFFIAFGALFSVGMGLDLGPQNQDIAALVGILVFLVFSLPLFIASYLVGKLSKEKDFSPLAYALWSFLGTISLFFVFNTALSGANFNGIQYIIIVGITYAIYTYLGISWGHRKKH